MMILVLLMTTLDLLSKLRSIKVSLKELKLKVWLTKQ